MANLTELEGCVLALVASSGGHTTYRLRKEFDASLTAQWRASTGALYPLVRRLERQGLVTAQKLSEDGRGAMVLKATAAGRAAVEAWLQSDGEFLGDITPDPVRTRINFLSILSPTKQHQAVVRMIAASENTLARLDARIALLGGNGDSIERIVHNGARMLVIARLEWLRGVIDQLPLQQGGRLR